MLGGIVVWQVMMLSILVVFFVLPVFAALFSKRVQGKQKAYWCFWSFIFGWFGYAGFYFAFVRREHGNAVNPI